MHIRRERQQLFSVVSMKLTYFNGKSQSATQMGLSEDVGARGIFTSVDQWFKWI